MKYYLDGTCIVELVAPMGLWRNVRRYFDAELDQAPFGSSAHISLSIDNTIGHRPVTVLGVSGGRLSDGRFVVPDGAGHWCVLEPGSLQGHYNAVDQVQLCCSEFKATVLLDWVLMPLAQFTQVATGSAPIHASAASLERDAPPIVFSAWSGVGKTNLLLHALAQGGVYYGDDRVNITSTGSIVASSRRVSIYGYNRSLAPRLSASKKARLTLGDTLHRGARRLPGSAGFLLSYAANGLGATRAGAAELGGQKGTHAVPAAHVLCFGSRQLDSRSEPLVQRLHAPDLNALARSHVAVMEYEFIWFQRYLQTWRWATSSPDDPWKHLISRMEENVRSYFAASERVFRMILPFGSPAGVAPRAWAQLVDQLR